MEYSDVRHTFCRNEETLNKFFSAQWAFFLPSSVAIVITINQTSLKITSFSKTCARVTMTHY